METPRLEEVRLTSFKSFTDQRLPLQDLTVLIGRNGSGKSNALDALTVLSRLLVGGWTLREALDAPRAGGEEPIRGGAEGCAPLGRDAFSVGCRVRAGEAAFDYDVEIEVRPTVRVRSERLVAVGGIRYASGLLPPGRVLMASSPDTSRPDMNVVSYFNGRREPETDGLIRQEFLLAYHVHGWVSERTRAGRLVIHAAEQLRGALEKVFLLDPVPHLMRRYVSEGDTELRRSGDNLSAVVRELRRTDPAALDQLKRLVGGMPEYPVAGVDTVQTPLGDVQLVLYEKGFHGLLNEVPARLLSDGMLRFLALGAALLHRPPGLGRLLVVEEIENGLYPTQASQVLQLIKDESSRRGVDVLFTTHSPALLNSLSAQDHPGVVVCTRDPESGESCLTRLTDLPGYVDLLAAGDLGDAVTKGRLPDALRPRRGEATSVEDFLRSL